MNRTRIAALTLCALLALLPFAAAAERLEHPRNTSANQGYFTIDAAGEFDYGYFASPYSERCEARGRTTWGMADLEPGPERGEDLSVDPLAVDQGKIDKLAAMSSWVTSDFMADDNTTASVWFDSEELSVVTLFFINKDKAVTSRVKVKDALNNIVVFDETFVLDKLPQPPQVVGLNATLGQLPEGAYLISVKHSQGSNKKAGLKYHITVAGGTF